MKSNARFPAILSATIALLTMLASPLQAQAADDCSCPEITCGVCQHQVDIKFYSAKCAHGKKVKSCKKPICETIQPMTKACLNKKMNKAHENATAKTPKPVPHMAVHHDKVRVNVGVVVAAVGKSWIQREDAHKKKARVGLKIFEHDIIETSASGKVKILFKDRNTVNITPGSKMQITALKTGTGDRDRTLLDLMYGKVRSKVQKKYQGAHYNYYRVRTKAAVAGVRGTDFVVSYFEKGGIETKVQTFHGTVAMAGRLDKKDDGSNLEKRGKHVEVTKGTYAKFVVAKNDAAPGGVFSDDDIKSFVAKGYLTPVYKLSAKELKILDQETSIKPGENPGRGLASEDKTASNGLCQAPSAPLNYCAWKCANNPKGANRCRTDLPGVNCVRTRTRS